METWPTTRQTARVAWRPNQEAPLGIALVTGGPRHGDWSAYCLSQQLGTWNFHAVAQDDEGNSGIPRLHTQARSQKYASPFMHLEM